MENKFNGMSAIKICIDKHDNLERKSITEPFIPLFRRYINEGFVHNSNILIPLLFIEFYINIAYHCESRNELL